MMNGLDLGRYALHSCAALAFLAGCNHNKSTQSFANYTFRLPSPAPTWPNYSATDYKNDRKHSLTPSDVRALRKTLAALKACQRPYLRYAFPSNPDVMPFVLFLNRTDVSAEHVLWTNNQYIDRQDGNVFPANGPLPDWNGIEYEAAALNC